MPSIPLLSRLLLLVQPVTEPEDGAPVEMEAPHLAAQLVPEVYRPLSTALGAESAGRV